MFITYCYNTGLMPEYEYPILVEGLNKTFYNKKASIPEKVAVDDLSFHVKKGEIFGLLGPNGAGKTTTIKMLSTLLIPTSGKAEVLGIDVTTGSDREIRKKINLVSGGERGLYYRLSGRQNLKFFSDLYGIPPAEQKKKIDDLLELFGLTEAADVKVEEYSRGMKQRIHLARALVNDPDVLYLDEPTIGLDPEVSRDVRAMVRKMAARGTTIILTTHYMFEAEELCDRILIISQGKAVGYGSVDELKKMVNSTAVIEIVTADDPHEAVDTVSEMTGVIHVKSERIGGGKFVTRINVEEGSDILSDLDNIFKDHGVRRIGYDEPTLEDVYLSLVGADES